jgi:hypothetical protein
MKALIGVLVLFVAWLIYLDVAYCLHCATRTLGSGSASRGSLR